MNDFELLESQKKSGVVKKKNCQNCKFHEEEHGANYCGSGFSQSDTFSKIKEHQDSHKYCLSFISRGCGDKK